MAARSGSYRTAAWWYGLGRVQMNGYAAERAAGVRRFSWILPSVNRGRGGGVIRCPYAYKGNASGRLPGGASPLPGGVRGMLAACACPGLCKPYKGGEKALFPPPVFVPFQLFRGGACPVLYGRFMPGIVHGGRYLSGIVSTGAQARGRVVPGAVAGASVRTCAGAGICGYAHGGAHGAFYGLFPGRVMSGYYRGYLRGLWGLMGALRRGQSSGHREAPRGFPGGRLGAGAVT